MKRFYLSLLILLTVAVQVFATDYYISPSGTGANPCVTGDPCSFATAHGLAGNGDRIIFKDGTYALSWTTVAAGVTYIAENKHKALIRNTGDDSSVIDISHDSITIDGLDVSGRDINGNLLASANGIIRHHTSSGSIIQNNILHDGQGDGITVAATVAGSILSNVTIKNNYLHTFGATNNGEAIYIGHNLAPSTATNIQVYENIISGYTQSCLDLKPRSRSVNVHHNFCFDQKYLSGAAPEKTDTEGNMTVRVDIAGVGHTVEDNIFNPRDDEATPTGECKPAIFWVTDDGGGIIQNNVAYGCDDAASTFIVKDRDTGVVGSTAIEITGNTFCDLASITMSCAGCNIHDNSIDAAQSACDAEVDRILSEVTGLMGGLDGPVVSDCSITSAAPTVLVVNWTCNGTSDCTPPLSQATNANFAVTYDSVAAAHAGGTVVSGTNTTLTTMDSAPSTGAVDIDLVVSYDAVRDTSAFGSSLVNLRNAAQTIQCTNSTAGGGPVSPTQVSFRGKVWDPNSSIDSTNYYPSSGAAVNTNYSIGS